MDFPIVVRKREEPIGSKATPATQVIVEMPSPIDIIPDEYARALIAELQELPQAWVYVISRVLSRPTPPDLIAWRQGPNNTKLAYVEPAYAIATRVALARIGVASDFEVLQTDVSSEAVECLCKLTLKFFHSGQWSTEVATQWGDCMRRAGMELGSSKKGAATDGLKKCLHELGWAMDVYATAPVKLPPPDPEQLRLESIEALYSIGSGKGLTASEMDKYIAKVLDGKTVGELQAKDITSLKRKLQKMSEEDAKEVVRDG